MKYRISRTILTVYWQISTEKQSRGSQSWQPKNFQCGDNSKKEKIWVDSTKPLYIEQFENSGVQGKLKQVIRDLPNASKRDFLMQRRDSAVALSPVQYYVTGDQVQLYNDELHALCYDLMIWVWSSGVIRECARLLEK